MFTRIMELRITVQHDNSEAVPTADDLARYMRGWLGGMPEPYAGVAVEKLKDEVKDLPPPIKGKLRLDFDPTISGE